MDALPPVRYVRTDDGYDIAYRVTGESGPPLVFIPPPLIDINRVWQWFPDWMEGLAERFRLIQYEMRGQGLSTRGLPEGVSMADFCRDLEAVIEDAGFPRVLIWGWAMPSHLAVSYALRNRERVLGLILNTCSTSGEPWGRVQFDMLPHENWQFFLRMTLPLGLTAEESRQRVRYMSESMTREDWDASCRAARASDVERELQEVGVPALVLHPRRWPSVTIEEAKRFAALIPNARFQVIEGSYIFGRAAPGLAAIDAFLKDLDLTTQYGSEPEAVDAHANLSSRELEVLRLLVAGRNNPQIAKELVISASTVAKHVSNILAKTESANRTEATTYAHRHGLV